MSGWHKFFSRCPVPGCDDSGRKVWTHANCGGTMFINCAAVMGCGLCGDVYHVVKSQFKCSGHGNTFAQPNAMSIFYMSAIAGDVAATFKDVAWGMKLQSALQSAAETFL